MNLKFHDNQIIHWILKMINQLLTQVKGNLRRFPPQARRQQVPRKGNPKVKVRARARKRRNRPNSNPRSLNQPQRSHRRSPPHPHHHLPKRSHPQTQRLIGWVQLYTVEKCQTKPNKLLLLILDVFYLCRKQSQ